MSIHHPSLFLVDRSDVFDFRSHIVFARKMGLFARFRNESRDVYSTIEETLEVPEIQNQLKLMTLLISLILFLRLFTKQRLELLSGEHVLDMNALNNANLFKEVFLAYLNAAVLEPILAIAGLQEVEGQAFYINLFTIGSICWWIWLVTDAFDCEDVCQHFKYHVEIREEIQESKDASEYKWLQLSEINREVSRKDLVGVLKKDVALWFMLSCIGAAWMPGVVTHRDVLHAYVVVFLWILLHHSCRQTTTWSGG